MDDRKYKRKKYLINKPVQFFFSGITVYFIFVIIITIGGLTYFFTLNTILTQLELENKLIDAYEVIRKINLILLKRIGISLIMLLLLTFYLQIRFLHRIAGPLFRIEKCLREISEGKKVEKIKLRKKDFYKSLAEAVNKVIEYIESLRKD